MDELTIREEAILEAFVFLIVVFLCFPLILDVLSGGTTSNQGKAKKAPPPTPVPKEPQQQEDHVFDDLLDDWDSVWEQSEKNGEQTQVFDDPSDDWDSVWEQSEKNGEQP